MTSFYDVWTTLANTFDSISQKKKAIAGQYRAVKVEEK